MTKLTFDEAMERLGDERTVDWHDVQARALSRKIWVSGNGSPGCLYDNGPNYHATKADAIASCAFTAEWNDDSPNPYRGLVTALRKYHGFTADTGERFSISQTTLRDVL